MLDRKAIEAAKACLEDFEIVRPLTPTAIPKYDGSNRPFADWLELYKQENMDATSVVTGKNLYEGIILASAEAKIRRFKNVPTRQSCDVDVSGANEVNLDTVYTIADFNANSELMLKVTISSLCKLSAVILFSASVSMETIIFTVDEENNATILADSVNMISNFNIASCLPQTEGTYYVLFSVFSGGGTAALMLQSSTTYSANEPNDSPDQAVLRNETAYVYDTFDHAYDLDFIRLKVSTAEKYLMSIAFEDKNLSGTVNIGIYQKTDADGNSVDTWVNYRQGQAVPSMLVEWDVDTAGEYYIFVQYVSGDVLNQPYILSIRPVSTLPVPTVVKTGEKGITGVQSGYIDGIHWVMGAFKVVANFKQGLTKNVDGVYPSIVTGIVLIGKDKNGEFDTESNTNFSDEVLSTPDGLATISALLPYSYGNDGSFSGAKYVHKYDVNRVYVGYLTYENSKYNMKYLKDPYVYFDPFLNVSE